MNWKNITQELPNESGNYLASVSIPQGDGLYVFTDLVHFDCNNNRWFKCDPFDPNYVPNEDISHLIKGWITNSITYLG